MSRRARKQLISGVLGGATYSPDAQAFFARLATQPTPSRKTLYNNLFISLRSSGVLSKLDILWIAGADSATTRTNLVQASFGLTAVASPSFTADRGFTSDGVSSYLDSGFTPSTAGGNYSQNSASAGTWALTAPDANKTCGANTGGTGAAFLRPYQGAAHNDFNSVANANTSDSTLGAGGAGFAAYSRTLAASYKQYFSGVSVGTISRVSTGNPSAKFFFCASSDNLNAVNAPTTGQIAMGFVGGGLSDAEVLSLYNAASAYLVGVGAVFF
jgi:hypothetical protein